MMFGAMTSIVVAGEVVDTSKEVLPAAYDNPYFMGATFGYLDKMDTEFYSIHFGKDLSRKLCNWEQAIYLELGYAAPDDSSSFTYTPTPTPPPTSQLPTDEPSPVTVKVDVDFEMIPLTLNYKLERQLSNRFNVYLGAGVGAAFTDSEASSGSSKVSNSDTVFFAQAFAGLLYNINPKWELYGGARYIYLDEPGGEAWDAVESAGVASNDDWLVELGLRYNF